MHALQLVWPVTPCSVPSAHGVHADDPPIVATVPAAQALQSAPEVDAPREEVPAGQAVGATEPAAHQCPAGQACSQN